MSSGAPPARPEDGDDRSSSSSSSSSTLASKRKRGDSAERHGSSSSSSKDKSHHRSSSKRRDRDATGDGDHDRERSRSRERHSSRRKRRSRSRSRSRDRDHHHRADRHHHDRRDRKDHAEKRAKREDDNGGAKAGAPTASSSSSSLPENGAGDAAKPGAGAAATTAAAAGKAATLLPGLDLGALRAMKEKLKQEVEKRAKEQPGGPSSATQTLAGKTLPAGLPTAATSALLAKAAHDPVAAERLKAMVEIQSKINAKLAALQNRSSAAGSAPGPTLLPAAVSSGPAGPRPLRLDSEGREIDDQGRVISAGRVPLVATLAINKRVQRESLFKLESPTVETDPTKNPYFDPRMRAPKVGRTRRPKAFKFVAAGTYVKKAQRMRTKLAKEFLEGSMSVLGADGRVAIEGADAMPIDKSLMPMELLKEAEEIIQKEDEPVPDVEWWDLPLLLNKERYSNSDPPADPMLIENGSVSISSNINERRVTHLVEHPVILEPPTEKPPPGPMPLKLTKAEQKKMRRRARAEKLREQQERVLLGLEPPPKNRMKISNMMKVMTSEAVQDPTQIEKMVRTEMEERAKAHDARNQSRKLTPEQKRLKKLKKLKEDTTLITHVALFRVTNLSDERHKYKVDVNAQENFLNGCALLYRGCCLVLVEGGPKSIERYKKLMMRRIDWNDFTINEEEGEGEGEKAKERVVDRPHNSCSLVWEGTVLKSAFKNFQVDVFPSESDVRKFLKQRGVAHYWDACKYVTPLFDNKLLLS